MKDNPIESICRAGFALVKEHATLFSLETALAKQSIMPFAISLGCAVVLMISIWVTLLALATYGLYTQTHDILLSLAAILGVQLIVLVFVAFLTRQYQQRMQFKETRSHLKDYLRDDHEH